MESPNTLIIYFDNIVGKEPLLAAIEQLNATIIYEYNHFNAIAIKIADESVIEEVIEALSAVDGVLQVYRDHIYYIK